MVSAESARTVVGVLGNVISLFLFLSPVPTFVQIWKKGSVEQFSPTPYLATLMNCGLWVIYGLPMVHPHSLLVITINGSGMAIELVYLLLFLRFSDFRKRMRVLAVMLVELVLLGILALLVLTVAHATKLRSTVVGSLAVAGNIMMYASPLSVVKMVIATRSVEYMPFYLSLAAFANGVCWTTYAAIRFDPFIAMPNGLGTMFAVLQLLLYAAYYKSTKRQIMERKAKGEVGLAEGTVTAESKKMGSGAQKSLDQGNE